MSHTFKKNLFKDKVVFVAGGTSGINLGIAKGFGRLGASVIVIGRNPERAAAAEQAIKDETGANALALSCDVRDYDKVSEVCQTIQEKFGTIDVVVSGAAGNFFAPAVGLSSKGFRTVVDIDSVSYTHLTLPTTPYV